MQKLSRLYKVFSFLFVLNIFGAGVAFADIYPLEFTGACSSLDEDQLRAMLTNKNDTSWGSLPCAYRAANFLDSLPDRTSYKASIKGVSSKLYERAHAARTKLEKVSFNDIRSSILTSVWDWDAKYESSDGTLIVKICDGRSAAQIVRETMQDRTILFRMDCAHKLLTTLSQQEKQTYQRELRAIRREFWQRARPEMQQQGLYGRAYRYSAMFTTFEANNRWIFNGAPSVNGEEQRAIQQQTQATANFNQSMLEAFANNRVQGNVTPAPPPTQPTVRPTTDSTDEEPVYSSGVTATEQNQVNQVAGVLGKVSQGKPITRQERKIQILPGINVGDLLDNRGRMDYVESKFWEKIKDLVNNGQDLTPLMELVAKQPEWFDMHSLTLLALVYANSLKDNEGAKLLSFVTSDRKPQVRVATAQAALFFAKPGSYGKFSFTERDKKVLVSAAALVFRQLQDIPNYQQSLPYKLLAKQVGVIYPNASFEQIDSILRSQGSSSRGDSAALASIPSVLSGAVLGGPAVTKLSTLAPAAAVKLGVVGFAVVITYKVADVLLGGDARINFWSTVWDSLEEVQHEIFPSSAEWDDDLGWNETFPSSELDYDLGRTEVTQVLDLDKTLPLVVVNVRTESIVNEASLRRRRNTCMYTGKRDTAAEIKFEEWKESSNGQFKSWIYASGVDNVTRDKIKEYREVCVQNKPQAAYGPVDCGSWEGQLKEFFAVRQAFADASTRVQAHVKMKYLECNGTGSFVPEAEIAMTFEKPLEEVMGLVGEILKAKLKEFIKEKKFGMVGDLCKGNVLRYTEGHEGQSFSLTKKDNQPIMTRDNDGIYKHFHYEEYKTYGGNRPYVCNHSLFGQGPLPQ
ncbi:MAG: hypothetical protein J6X06_07070 [Elusimicrobiaceae bacterium]|nr:hypothetical protein [Elusimicrobiaceae bacterium]